MRSKQRLTENEAVDRGMNGGGEGPAENGDNQGEEETRAAVTIVSQGLAVSRLFPGGKWIRTRGSGAELLPVRVVLVRGACRADPGPSAGGGDSVRDCRGFGSSWSVLARLRAPAEEQMTAGCHLESRNITCLEEKPRVV
ncbi:hypothetical protein CSOJ01_11193 [Colletotrichum sojae]|uniref:Uncharacterized protein n=1 Tax=Colletotrichum sojae TaxID=2175907 RepID=A0A8H6IY53_9PEZI|nr:hypothetical protein CSOJ01_11193 [Colletotrichum sojae]